MHLKYLAIVYLGTYPESGKILLTIMIVFKSVYKKING